MVMTPFYSGAEDLIETLKLAEQMLLPIELLSQLPMTFRIGSRSLCSTMIFLRDDK